MKMSSLFFALAGGVALVLPAYAVDRYKQHAAPTVAPQAVTTPVGFIYRFSGVADDGGAPGVGRATSIHCSSWSNVSETLKVWIYNWDGSLVAGQTVTVLSKNTYTLSTHDTNIFAEDTLLSPGVTINQGMALLASSSTNMFCSAMIIDAASSSPVGTSLHLVRFRPFTTTEE